VELVGISLFIARLYRIPFRDADKRLPTEKYQTLSLKKGRDLLLFCNKYMTFLW
jgi:hypothetical protein